MENLTPWEVCVVVMGAVLALAATVNTLGSAIEKIVKAVKSARAPNAAQDGRLDALEDDMRQVKMLLSNDKKHLDALDEGNRITQRALLALLSHGIDGNNVEQMESAKHALEEHLINR